MEILVQGVKVRQEELAETVEIQFNQLSELGQKRLFKENKDMFFIEALLSKYESVRKLAILVRNDCSSATINRAIRKLLSLKSIYQLPDYNLIYILLNTDDFILSRQNIIPLTILANQKIKEWLVQHIN